MTARATLPKPGLPGLEDRWSRLITVTDADGIDRTWHVLDNAVTEPELTVVCVHGNPTWSYLWRRLLSVAPPRWRIIAPDQLGMGYSDRLDEPRTLAQRVVDLGLLTDAMGVTGPTATLAHDWGGAISLGWALEHRAQLRAVVLTNTAVHLPAGVAGPALIRLAHLRALRTVLCARTPVFVRAATALSRPPLASAVRGAFAAPYVGADRRRSVRDFVADIPFTPEHPSAARLDQISAGITALDVPALMLWGPRDPVFAQPYLDDLLTRLPQAAVHRYEQASHLVTEDAPQYADTVVRWLSDLDATHEAVHALPPTVTSTTPETAAKPSSLGDRLDARAGDPGAAVVEVGRRTVSWDRLQRQVADLAVGLAGIGVRRGRRVALLVPPSADLTAAVYAVWRAGGSVVVADKGLGVRGMGRALRSARVDYVIGTAQGLGAARVMRLPGTRIAAGGCPRAARRVLGVHHTLAGLASQGRGMPRPAKASQDDECAVVFTSGATGPAKGVVYRHRQVGAQLDVVTDTYALSGEDRIVAAFAPFSLYGPGLGIGSAVPDMDVTSPGTLTAAALADAVLAIEATVVFASPAALRNVVATADALSAAHREALAGVRLLMSAGAPVPAELLRSLRDVLPAAQAHTPYGMTEALPVTDISLEEIEAAGVGAGVCVGTPLPSVDVTVSPLSSTGEADGDLTTDPGVTGEVCVRAAHVKDHYDALWATERASSRNPGWHRTGDVGHLDPQGRLWIEGRLEHLILTASGVVTPVGIERRVEALAEVRAAAVVGVGPVGTQQIVVTVVAEAGHGAGRGASPVASLSLTQAVRAVAGLDVAAVLVTPALPVDIRHASKVDRRQVKGWATTVLAGSHT